MFTGVIDLVWGLNAVPFQLLSWSQDSAAPSVGSQPWRGLNQTQLVGSKHRNEAIETDSCFDGTRVIVLFATSINGSQITFNGQ